MLWLGTSWKRNDVTGSNRGNENLYEQSADVIVEATPFDLPEYFSMQVQQLKLSSAINGDTIQLSAKSSDADERIALLVAEKLPGRNSLEFQQRESISFFPIVHHNQPMFAFARSYCGPVDSQNQRKMISNVALLTEAQFQKFEFHAPNVIYCLRTSGQFTLSTDDSAILPTLELPDRYSLQIIGQRTPREFQEQVVSSLNVHEQVGVLGVDAPFDLVASVFNEQSPHDRAELSFATSRRANGTAKFRLLVHKQIDPDLKREFIQQQIRPITPGVVTAS